MKQHEVRRRDVRRTWSAINARTPEAVVVEGVTVWSPEGSASAPGLSVQWVDGRIVDLPRLSGIKVS